MLSQLFHVMLSAVSVGSTCSLCGASAGSAFLAVYVITHERILLPCMCFLAGKAGMTMLLCGISASLGQVIMDSAGLAFGINIYIAAQIFVLAVSILMIAEGIRNMTAKRRFFDKEYSGDCGGNCGENCHGGCGRVRTGRKEDGFLALLVSGLACGVTPCAPLFLVLGQCVTLSIPLALISGMVFSTVGFISPVLFWFVISRLLAGKLRQDAAQYLDWFRLGCYILLLVVTIYTISVYIR